MNKFIVLSFATMGWAFWALSGGAEFEPKSKRLAESPTPAPAIKPDTPNARSAAEVARAVPTVRVAPKPAQAPQITNNVFAVAPDSPVSAFETPQAVVVASAKDTTTPEITAKPAAPAPDLRQVRGSRVNMRGGPGTNYGVLAVLSRGQEVHILRNESGWVKLRDQQSGTVGWMSAKMITTADR